MANVFNVAEVIDMGIEKEKKRRDFYGLAATRFKEKDMVDLFTRLRDWEAEHIRKFTDIRNSVDNIEVAENYQGEFEGYMKALVDDMLYRQVSAEQFPKYVKTPLDAISFGIMFEKDAILFFNELLYYMEPAHEEKVRALVQEEKQHIIYLTELKRKYS